MSDIDYMHRLDVLERSAIALFDTNKGVSIHDVASRLLTLVNGHGYTKDELAGMLSLAIAERGHAIHEGDWG